MSLKFTICTPKNLICFGFFKKYHSDDLENNEWEEIDGVKEVLQPEENGGESTAEIYLDGPERLQIYTNEQTER